MDDSKLNDLFKEFRSKYPKMDYFTQEEIFQLGRMCFHLGNDSEKDSHKMNSKKVLRSDGMEYMSMTEAAKVNKIARQNIGSAIKEGWKSGGFYWKYKN